MEIEKDTLSKIITEGKSIVTDSKELHDKNEISLPGNFTVDQRTGAQARKLSENLIYRKKTEISIENLTNKIRNSLLEISEKDLINQDLKSTIKYLIESFNHIKLLQYQCDTLKIFLQKQSKILTDRNDEMDRLKELYADIKQTPLTIQSF